MGKHSATRFSTYFSTHQSCLEKLKAVGIVTHENLGLEPIGDGLLQIKGDLQIRDKLILTVNKTLKETKSISKHEVQTVKYSYNLRLPDARNLFRYDNAHQHLYLGHKTDFHVHRFDLISGEEHSKSPFEIVDIEDWPTLGETLKEADEYYWKLLSENCL